MNPILPPVFYELWNRFTRFFATGAKYENSPVIFEPKLERTDEVKNKAGIWHLAQRTSCSPEFDALVFNEFIDCINRD